MLRDLFSLFPAHAGVIPTPGQESPFFSAFPRTCGGDPYTQNPTQNAILFSPHMRG